MNHSDYTVHITCDCDTCKTNATRLGLAFPLAARIRPVTASGLGITEKNSGRKSKTHGLVYAAHDPSLRGYKGTRISIEA